MGDGGIKLDVMGGGGRGGYGSTGGRETSSTKLISASSNEMVRTDKNPC